MDTTPRWWNKPVEYLWCPPHEKLMIARLLLEELSKVDRVW